MNSDRHIDCEYLFNENIGLVYMIVNRFNVSSFDKDDLIQSGLIGLISAARNFDVSKGYKFSTYAVKYILGNVKKELEKIKIHHKSEEFCEYIENTIIDENTKLTKIENKGNDLEYYLYLVSKEDEVIRKIIEYRLNYSYSENMIAKELGISQSTVSRKLLKFKKMICEASK